MSEIIFKEKYLKELEEYYWGNLAKNNEDEAGLERWLEALSNQDARAILNK